MPATFLSLWPSSHTSAPTRAALSSGANRAKLSYEMMSRSDLPAPPSSKKSATCCRLVLGLFVARSISASPTAVGASCDALPNHLRYSRLQLPTSVAGHTTIALRALAPSSAPPAAPNASAVHANSLAPARARR